MTYFNDDKKQYQATLLKGTPVLESFKLARYLMFVQVYQHPARLIADRMFLRSFELYLLNENTSMKKLLKLKENEKNFIKFYFHLDDNSVYELVLNSDKSSLLMN